MNAKEKVRYAVANDLDTDANDAFLEGRKGDAKAMCIAADKLRMGSRLTAAEMRYAEPYIQMRLKKVI